jgi:hypothetical protein
MENNMQAAVKRLIKIGPLPSSSAATTAALQEFEALLAEVRTPISDDEARALVRLFGPDDCFGLGWSLLHLIETSPGWLIEDALVNLHGEWVERLRQRVE